MTTTNWRRKYKEGLIYDPIPTLSVALMEEVSGLDFQQIRQMDIKTFLKKYKEIYLRTLATMSDDDVHYQALLLNYLYPMVRDMLELTENRRAQMKKKNDMLSK
ncbi:MAG TPA: hypothetical protein VFJ05_07005 [Nitrososphaeraceae archaeon]|nr:hypothetical protein [Nitrososphaeraceae archaeon]